MDHERYRHMHGQSGSSMKKASFEITLKDKKQIAEGTWAFVFEKPEGFHFTAGQHVRMTLMNPSETDSEGNSRFLSIASTPQEKDLVFAMRMRDTAFKRTLKNMEIGQRVLVQILLGVPHGAFALHQDASKPAVFLIGGIGIVPAYSMIKDALERKLPHKIFLFYSNRRPEDAPFLDELQSLATQHSSFTFVPTMTEPEKSARQWRGEKGFINHSMLSRYRKDLQHAVYYIAGLPEMASAMKTLVMGLGVSEESIHAEEFTGFNLNDMQDTAPHAWKKHAVIVFLVVVVLVVIILHVFTATSLQNSFSLTSPFLYVMLGLMLLIIPYKFKHLMSFKNTLFHKDK